MDDLSALIDEPALPIDREILDVAKVVIAVHGNDAFEKARALFREMMEKDDIWAASAAYRVMQAIAALSLTERGSGVTVH